MQRALRPYVTTGIAIVGATAIAVTPIVATPTTTDVQIPNPTAQVERAVELTANEIQNAFNSLAFGGAQALVTLAQLPAPLVARILGLPSDQAAAILLTGLALGLNGPAISGTAAIGTALQRIADSDDLEQLLTNLIGAPGTLLDGIVNGGYGPDLDSLLGNLSPFPVVAGGLLRGALPLGTVVGSPLRLILPGTFPTLQGLIATLSGLLNPTQMASINSLAVAAPDSTVEDGVNDLLFAATAATLRIVTLAAPLLEPILGDQAAAFLALGTVGLLGPLISGTGAVGTALQRIINSDDLGGLFSNLVAAPGTAIDGIVNGGYGPNLQSLLPLPPSIGSIPVKGVFAPGIIQNPGFNYATLASTPLAGIGIRPTSGGVNLLPPGTIAVLQGLVERIFGALPAAETLNTNTLRATGGDQQDLKVYGLARDDQGKLMLTENKVEGQAPVEGPQDAPKKHRQRVELNVVKLNPLDQNNKDGDDATQVGNSSGTTTTPKHGLGFGKTPVQDLVKRVLGGLSGNDNDDDGGAAAASDEGAEKAAS